ncbi:HEPN domain-containing protein [Pedobacter sp. BG31]|uniref:HEPN domain-containing protein n=1 Tax=Pedobacter sp. BG31 TaxID=3349697 RepID=UPI0035F2F2B7
MEKENKIAIAGRIAQAIAVERIYGFEYGSGDNFGLHLLILACSPDGAKLTELDPFVLMAINEEKTSFRIYQASEIRRLQTEDSIYHLSICCHSNLLYEADEATPMPQFSVEDLRQVRLRSAAAYDSAMLRVASFSEGAKFYIEKNDDTVALFMLHQVCELTCRALEIGLCGNEKRSHQLEQHRKYLKKLLPEFEIIPKEFDVEAGRLMLNMMDKAYSAVRYESGFSAEGIDIQSVHQLALDFRKYVEATIRLFLESGDDIFEQEPISAKIPLQVVEHMGQTSSDEVLVGILEIITHYLEPQAVYQLGMRTDSETQDGIFGNSAIISRIGVHYDLLVISEVANPYALNLQQHITHRCGEGVSVLLLIHGQNEFSKAVQRGSSFFHAIAKSGKLLLGSEIPSKMIATDARRYSAEKLDRSTLNRNTRAEEFLRCSGEMIDEGHMVLSISLMSQAVEQACLGLILKYLEYKPNLCRVGHLLDICGMFWPQARLYFPTVLNNDRSMYRRLSDGQSNARYGIDEIDDWSDAWGLYRKTEAFVGDVILLSKNSLVTAENPE